MGEELCALDWSELVAKLAAARDLRSELASQANGVLASFDALSAHHIALQHDKAPEGLTAGNSKHSVNPDALANGKDACATSDRRADRDDPANRGNT
ncbi:hypothetical protein [Erythrobacter alti]|uniref:hypothetical protein n=1 Tax=Erythrobacter alti TaxID=1896145 RepID=UPI0030F3D7C5